MHLITEAGKHASADPAAGVAGEIDQRRRHVVRVEFAPGPALRVRQLFDGNAGGQACSRLRVDHVAGDAVGSQSLRAGQRQCDDSCFASGVCNLGIHSKKACIRPKVDEPPALSGPRPMRGRQTRRVERSPSVYPHLDVPVFDGCVGYRAMAHNSSSVDKNVEPAVGLNRATDERFDVFPPRAIELDAGVRDDDGGALSRECSRDRSPNASSTPGDDGDLVRKPAAWRGHFRDP